MEPSEIGLIVDVLLNKSWGKTPVGGRPRSKRWWQDRLESLINKEEDYVLPENMWEPGIVGDIPIPFEIEIGIPELNYDTLLTAWKNYEKNKNHR